MSANTHSLQFDGSGSLVIPNQSYVNFGSGSYTIMFWFTRGSSPASAEALFNKQSAANNWALQVRVNTNGTLNCQQYDGGTNPSWSTTTNVCDGTARNIAVVLNDSGTNRILVDGTQEGTASHLAVTNAADVKVGQAGTGGEGVDGAYFVDEVVIYDTNLSAAVIAARLQREHDVEGYASLQGYYKLNNNANDSSTNANTATMSGAAYSSTVPFATYATSAVAGVNRSYGFII